MIGGHDVESSERHVEAVAVANHPTGLRIG